MKAIEPTLEQARRVAIRAQALDGTETNVLDVVRRLGFLQMDPISTIAPPQQLVLYTRLGRFDVERARPAALGGAQALRVERVHLADRGPAARSRRMGGAGSEPSAARGRGLPEANARFRRYVLRELERNGPMLSRDLKDDLLRSARHTAGGAPGRCD